MDWNCLPITLQAQIPELYLDEMGHMNVMWYGHLFSKATGRLFKLIGLNREYCEKNQAGTFALEQHVRYLVEVRVGQHVTIRSQLLGRSAKIYHFMNYMIKDEGEVLAATGEFVGAHVDMSTRRTSPLPPQIATAFDRLLAEHSRLPWAAPVCGVMGVGLGGTGSKQQGA
jgi:acyl-CoA thioesterase FadM